MKDKVHSPLSARKYNKIEEKCKKICAFQIFVVPLPLINSIVSLHRSGAFILWRLLIFFDCPSECRGVFFLLIVIPTLQ